MLFLHVENEDNRGPGTAQLAAACDWTTWGAQCQVSIKGFINRSYRGPQATRCFLCLHYPESTLVEKDDMGKSQNQTIPRPRSEQYDKNLAQ